MSPITDWESLAKENKEANKGFEPAPQGNYNLTITEVVTAVAKDSGNTKFDATMVIDSGPYKNKKVWHSFTVAKDSKKGLGIFFQNMNVFGMPIDFFNANTQDETIRQNLVGKRLSADLMIDTFNPDKPKNKVDKGWSIKAPTGPSELDLPAVAGVPGGAMTASPAAGPQYTAATPTPQAAPPTQYQAQPQSPPVYQQNPPEPVHQQDIDPWQTPQQPAQQQAPPQQYSQQAPPPPPPAGATWGAPPPPPPGLQ